MTRDEIIEEIRRGWGPSYEIVVRWMTSYGDLGMDPLHFIVYDVKAESRDYTERRCLVHDGRHGKTDIIVEWEEGW